jgi:hypothetical protein
MRYGHIPGAAYRLHEAYRSLTGLDLPLSLERVQLWLSWERAGHTGADLELVVRYLQREIRARKRLEGSLRLSNLLDPERFGEDLAFAKAAQKGRGIPGAAAPAPAAPPENWLAIARRIAPPGAVIPARWADLPGPVRQRIREIAAAQESRPAPRPEPGNPKPETGNLKPETRTEGETRR